MTEKIVLENEIEIKEKIVECLHQLKTQQCKLEDLIFINVPAPVFDSTQSIQFSSWLLQVKDSAEIIYKSAAQFVSLAEESNQVDTKCAKFFHSFQVQYNALGDFFETITHPCHVTNSDS